MLERGDWVKGELAADGTEAASFLLYNADGVAITDLTGKRLVISNIWINSAAAAGTLLSVIMDVDAGGDVDAGETIVAGTFSQYGGIVLPLSTPFYCRKATIPKVIPGAAGAIRAGFVGYLIPA